MIGLIVVLILAALALWVVRTLLPVLKLPEPIGTILYVVIVVIVVLYIVQALGVIAWPVVRIPR